MEANDAAKDLAEALSLLRSIPTTRCPVCGGYEWKRLPSGLLLIRHEEGCRLATLLARYPTSR